MNAMIIGKPSANFFKIALDDMGLKSSEVAMIGDDIDGSQRVGLTGILLKTGKYHQSYAEASQVKPDLLIGSIADLPKLLRL
jgi:ribonucleotide monophosphatase NagD (HAD superfamily)